MATNVSVEMFVRFLGHIPEITFAIDLQGSVTWCNARAVERLLITPGTPIEDVLDPGSVSKVAQSLFEVKDGNDLITELVFVVDNRPVLHSAHLFCYQNSIILMARADVDDNARFQQLSSLFSEFASLQRESTRQESELKKQGYLLATLTRELETERRRLLSLIDQLPEGIVIVNDQSGDIEMTNLRIQEIWGTSGPPGNISDIPFFSTNYDPVAPADLPLFRSMALKQDEGPVDYIVNGPDEGGQPTFVQVSASPVLDERNEVAGAAMSIVDVTEHIQLQDSLELQALQDPLTGLGNRRGFTCYVQEALEEIRDSDTSIAILYIDLDGFKAVNDRLGHDAGDVAIMEAGARLRKAVREYDAIARIGGDEFTILLAPVDGRDQVDVIVRRILECLGEPIVINGQTIRLPGCVGICVASGNEQFTPAELIRRADVAMYDAKATGTSRWAYFQESIDPDGRTSISMTEAIHQALDTEQFEMLYRPVVDLRNGKVRQVEIAMYWHSASEGLLDDNEIRSRAWRSGLIHAIAERAAELGERDRPIMIEAIGNRENIVMSRHYWIEYLKEERVVDQLLEIARDVQHTPITVWMELSGHLLPGDYAALDQLSRLYDAGIRYSLAHAGDYNGDLGLLRHLPFESIVASAELVKSGPADSRSLRQLRSMVAIAREFEIPVKAPGIDTNEELQSVRELGFDLGSGSLFSQPLSAGEIVGFSIDHVFALGVR